MSKDLRNIIKSFKLYKETSKKPVKEKVYKDITTDYHRYILEKVIHGEKIGLPNRCGHLSIKGRKQTAKIDEKGNITGLPPHYTKTKELWERNPEAKKAKQLVYCTNEHSNQIVYSFVWQKKDITAKYKEMYNLRVSRIYKRKLWKLIMNGNMYVTK